ncbi:response regulator transcription factor [Vaginisenegalia massiliensis]|uniref:response regulator transcription factor n=1 Tax=Vaginisenegalia massiliensis TaxID=2058294 RepID=UPI000F522F1A|nr:response regulator transcription factor [Vaginisenegalia massiliensis]
MRKILIVDDEPHLLTLLEYNLVQAGYDVQVADNGLDAYNRIIAEKFDFIILDVMLPGMDGMDVCRRVRQKQVATPILMLTAKDGEYEKIIGLELGADDYMTKPFSPREVVARVKAILRRVSQDALPEQIVATKENAGTNDHKEGQADASENSQTEADGNQCMVLGDVEIFTDRYEVRVKGEEIEITPKEFELLVYMASRKGRILSREQLLNRIWNFDYAGETRIVDVHVSHLREKIEQDTKRPQYIKTVRGFGYKFEVPGE